MYVCRFPQLQVKQQSSKFYSQLPKLSFFFFSCFEHHELLRFVSQLILRQWNVYFITVENLELTNNIAICQFYLMRTVAPDDHERECGYRLKIFNITNSCNCSLPTFWLQEGYFIIGSLYQILLINDYTFCINNLIHILPLMFYNIIYEPN